MVAVLDPDYQGVSLPQKQRAIFYKNYRMTLVATVYGYRYFICDLDAEPRCEKAAKGLAPADRKVLFEELAKQIEVDTNRGALPRLRLPLHDGAVSGGIDWENQDRYLDSSGPLAAGEEALASQRANELLYGQFDAGAGLRILQRIIDSPGVNPFVKLAAQRGYIDYCG